KKHPLGEKRNHPGSKLRQGFWMVFRFGVNNWGFMREILISQSIGKRLHFVFYWTIIGWYKAFCSNKM
ncbi:hypothetical protein RLC28_01390, partial [Streptococcus pneumoniae]